jgi:dTDP-glucose pyrophosphorylase
MSSPDLYVVIPAAGLGTRFAEFGFKTPKFMLPINATGTTMIEAAIDTLNVPASLKVKYIFITRTQLRTPEMERALARFDPIWICLDRITQGAAETTLIGIKNLQDDVPIMVSNSDQILANWDCAGFLERCRGKSGGVLTYTPEYELKLGNTDKHSFVSVEKGIVRFTEKIVTSREALVGVHYFDSRKTYLDAYADTLARNERAPNGEFYLSLTYNGVVRNGGSVEIIPMKQGEIFYPTGEPKDYFLYINTVSRFCPVLSTSKLLVSTQGLQVEVLDEKDDREAGPLFVSLDGSDRVRRGDPLPGKVLRIVHPLVVTVPENTELSLQGMVRGWFIGDFEPSLIRTAEFEVTILHFKKGERCAFHVHHEAVEYNHLVSGRLDFNGAIIEAGTTFIIPKDVLACPIYLEESIVVCAKIPSIPKDKELI